MKRFKVFSGVLALLLGAGLSPLHGRRICLSLAARMGDVFRSISLMRKRSQCVPEQSRSEKRGALSCEVMGGCMKALGFCLHGDGHDFDPGWLETGWDFVKKAALYR